MTLSDAKSLDVHVADSTITCVIGRHKGKNILGDKVIVNLFIDWQTITNPLNPALV